MRESEGKYDPRNTLGGIYACAKRKEVDIFAYSWRLT